MFLIFLLSALFNFGQISSMQQQHTPKANNSCQSTPRTQTCKIINGSRAQSFEVGATKEAENKTSRRLFASSSDDDQITDNDEQIFEMIQEGSQQKRADENNTKSPFLDNDNLLEESINQKNQDLRTSRHFSKVTNQSIKKYDSLPVPPPLSYTKIVPLDEIPDTKFIEEIQNLFFIENNIFGLELSLNDIFPLDYENQSPTEIQNYLNDRYKFICCYNKDNVLTGLLFYIVYTDSSNQTKKAAIQFYIENTDKSQPENLSRVLSILEDICRKEKCNEISITSFDPQQKSYSMKYGYTIPGSLGALIKRL